MIFPTVRRGNSQHSCGERHTWGDLGKDRDGFWMAKECCSEPKLYLLRPGALLASSLQGAPEELRREIRNFSPAKVY